jgi:tetratricopeptide (TPR) repeat protein
MKAIHFLPRILCTLLVMTSIALAQDQKPPSQGEMDAAKKVQDAKDLPAKMKQAEEFMKKNSKSSIRPKVAEHIAFEIGNVGDPGQRLNHIQAYSKMFSTDAEQSYILPSLVDAYAQTDKLDDAFKLAPKAFEKTPDNVLLMTQLALKGSNAVRQGNAQHAEASKQYATKAIEIIESDKKPATINDQFWGEVKTKWLPELHQALGFIAFAGGDAAEAKTRFQKVTEMNPGNPNGYLMLASFADGEYQRAAMEYNTASGAAKDAALKKAYGHLDTVIDYYARVVALTAPKPEYKQIHDQVLPVLQESYKIRKGSLDGLQQLVDKYKK